MTNIHYFQRYSSPENTVTNNTMQLLARIYDYSPRQAGAFLSDLSGEEVEIGVSINQQVKVGSSIPDASIIQNSFKILVETKVDAGVDVDQLVRHAEQFSDESIQILLLMTRETIAAEHINIIESEVRKISPKIIFKNITFEDVCNALRGRFQPFEEAINSIVDDYWKYCNDAGLFDQSKYLMRVLPCGVSIDLNATYGVYFHPSDRGYTDHAYLGVYANKAVRYIWKLDSVFDVEWDGEFLRKSLVSGRDTDLYDQKIISIINDAKERCGYDVKLGHRFFCGDPVETAYEKTSPGGIQGARFFNIKEVLGDFDSVEDVACRLKEHTWH